MAKKKPAKKKAAAKKPAGFSRAALVKHAAEHAAMKKLGIGGKPKKAKAKSAT